MQQVRSVLDNQVKLREELRAKNLQERQEFEKKMVEQAKKDLEVER